MAGPRADFEARHQGPRASAWADWWASGDQGATGQAASRSDPPPEGEPTAAQPVRPLFPTSWCHGSAGIALGRLAARDLLDGPKAPKEVTGALESLRQRVESPSFVEETTNDLCCGHMGIAEVLLESSLRLQDQALLTAARSLGLRVVLQARNGGGYKVRAARGTGEYSPSLFQGESGSATRCCAWPGRRPFRAFSLWTRKSGQVEPEGRGHQRDPQDGGRRGTRAPWAGLSSLNYPPGQLHTYILKQRRGE